MFSNPNHIFHLFLAWRLWSLKYLIHIRILCSFISMLYIYRNDAAMAEERGIQTLKLKRRYRGRALKTAAMDRFHP